MKKFSQFLGIHRGNKHFKQASNTILVQNRIGGGNLWNPALNPIEQGAVSSATGNNTSSTTRLRTAGLIKVQPNTAYAISTNLARIFVVQLNSDGQVNGVNSGWIHQMPYKFTTPNDCYYIRITFANNENSEITVDDFEWLKIIPD